MTRTPSEIAAHAAGAHAYPHERWDDFDERYEARGGYHPMQEKSFALADIARRAALEAARHQPTTPGEQGEEG